MRRKEIELPDWYRRGRRVDVLARSADAEFILDPEEFDLDWRECQVPTSAFPQLHHKNFAAYVADMALYDDDPIRSAEKVRTTQAWMDRRPEQALRESPLLVFLHNGQLDLLDGWHRLGLAHYQYGLNSVTALVAIPSESPTTTA